MITFHSCVIACVVLMHIMQMDDQRQSKSAMARCLFRDFKSSNIVSCASIWIIFLPLAVEHIEISPLDLVCTLPPLYLLAHSLTIPNTTLTPYISLALCVYVPMFIVTQSSNLKLMYNSAPSGTNHCIMVVLTAVHVLNTLKGRSFQPSFAILSLSLLLSNHSHIIMTSPCIASSFTPTVCSDSQNSVLNSLVSMVPSFEQQYHHPYEPRRFSYAEMLSSEQPYYMTSNTTPSPPPSSLSSISSNNSSTDDLMDPVVSMAALSSNFLSPVHPLASSHRHSIGGPAVFPQLNFYDPLPNHGNVRHHSFSHPPPAAELFETPKKPSSTTTKKMTRSRGRRVSNAPSNNGARMFTCTADGCGKMFKRSEHLKRHIRSIHTLEKRKFIIYTILWNMKLTSIFDSIAFECPYQSCSKRFSRSDNLNQHIRIHRHSSSAKDTKPSMVASTSAPTQPSLVPSFMWFCCIKQYSSQQGNFQKRKKNQPLRMLAIRQGGLIIILFFFILQIHLFTLLQQL